jgi:hypothetical protein
MPLSGPLTGFTDRAKGKSYVPSSALQQFGKGAATSAGGGNLACQVGPIGNGADTTEDVLFTGTLPANSLDLNGRQVLIEAYGAISATSAVKTLKIYFGSVVWTPILITPAATTAGDWQASLLITKVGPSAQRMVGSADFSAAATVRSVTRFTGAENDAAGITIKITGQSSVATANTVSADTFTVGGYN